ncbi:hypothetical protein GCM10010400_64520 [Streptomyces aculeolatus]|uniref:transcriptional regulator n=1 Tax=Streptomyces aculeolatus TaxID=270689 RepID=UPI001CEC8D7F|nr:transcriptional regulator [Streptomyces aculeolatus]
MPGRTDDFGKYGAQGEHGGQATARVLDSLVDGITSPITTRRGLTARVRYLTRSEAGRQAMREAGITVKDRTIKAWLSGKQRPSKANLKKIDAAYWAYRRRNVARYLLRRLNGGGGTRVEIHPLDQSRVARPHQRILEYRSLNIRNWDAIVAAWADRDHGALEAAWIDKMVDLGSQWGKYEYVSSVGFAA